LLAFIQEAMAREDIPLVSVYLIQKTTDAEAFMECRYDDKRQLLGIAQFDAPTGPPRRVMVLGQQLALLNHWNSQRYDACVSDKTNRLTGGVVFPTRLGELLERHQRDTSWRKQGLK
jgi:hypothetical protein